MSKHRNLFSLYLFYAVYFVGMGLTTYASKYFGAIDLSNTQIGMTTAVPAFVAIFAQPVWGMLSDRSAYKRNVILVGLFVAGLCAFAADRLSGSFVPMLIALTLMNTFTLPALPVGNAVAIEYSSSVGKSFGPIRMAGTIGYQIAILTAGFIMSEKLTGLYAVYGAILIAAALSAALMPPIRGYQHEGKKVSLAVFLQNRRIMALLGLVFLAQLGNQFYLAFFAKHLGDIGISNSLIGVITTLSVIMEIPFLFFGDKLYQKMSIWKWMWIGLLITGLRFCALSLTLSPLVILLTQLPSVAMFACFEFFPAIYLSAAVDRELLGSAQNVYQVVAFGVSRILATLLGGAVSEVVGLSMVFRCVGLLLVLVSVLAYVPLWKRSEQALS